MHISFKLQAIRLLVPHHPLPFFALMFVPFIVDVAINASNTSIYPSVAATIFDYVLGGSRHRGCLK